MIFALGIGNVTYLYLKRTDFSKYEVFWSNLILSFIIGFFASIFLFALSTIIADYFAAPELKSYLRIYGFILFLKFPLGVTESAVVLYGKVKSFTVQSLLLTIFKTSLLILIIQLTNNLTFLFIAFTLLGLIHLIISFLLVPNDFFKNFHWKKSMMSKMLYEGFFIALNNIFGRATLLMDKAIVSTMLVPSQYALYRNGAIEIPFFSGIYRTVSTIVLPDISRLISMGNIQEVIRLKRKAITNTAFVVYPVLVFLLFFNERFIILYLSEKYIETVPVFTVFNLTLLIRINSYSDVILCTGRYKTLIKITAIGFLTGVVLNIIFIYFFGFIGAAIATLFSIALVNYYYLILTSKVLKIPIFAFFDFSFLGKTLLICFFISLVISFLPLPKTNLFSFLFLLSIYIPTVYLILLRFVLKDKTVFFTLLDKFPFKNQYIRKILSKWS